jgi:hypothetical protein
MAEQTVTTSGIKLSDELKQLVNEAYGNRMAIIFAYVDNDGQPHISFRGSMQAYTDDSFAMWARNPEGGLLKQISSGGNNRVTMMYRNPQERITYLFYGRARINDDPDFRNQVYEHQHEFERNFDPDRKGRALVVDLDLVEGGPPDNKIRMVRES